MTEVSTGVQERLVASANASASYCRALWVAFVTYAATISILASGTTHETLIRAAPVRMPLFQTDVPLLLFYSVAPLLLVLFHVHLLLKLHDLELRIDGVRQSAANGPEYQSLRLYLVGFDFALLSGNLVSNPSERRVLRAIATITLYALPLVVLLYFQALLLPYHSKTVLWIHRLQIVADVGFMLLINSWSPSSGQRLADLPRYILGRPGRRLTARLAIRAKNAAIFFRRHRSAVRSTLVHGPVLIVSLLLFAIPGEPQAVVWNTINTIRIYDTPDDSGFLEHFGLHRNLKLRFATLWQKEVPPELLAVYEAQWLKLGEAPVPDKDSMLAARRAHGGRIDLRGRDLSFADLFGSTIIGADFTGADLTEATLAQANVSGSNFSDATLARSNLLLADASEAVFQSATMTDSFLSGANFDGADFTTADISGSGMEDSRAINADFFRVSAQGVSFGRSLLAGANFEEAILFGADFRESRLLGAKFPGAHALGAGFDRADARFAEWTGAHLAAASFYRADLTGARFVSARLMGASLKGAAVTGAVFDEADVTLNDLRAQRIDTGLTATKVLAGLEGGYPGFKADDKLRSDIVAAGRRFAQPDRIFSNATGTYVLLDDPASAPAKLAPVRAGDYFASLNSFIAAIVCRMATGHFERISQSVAYADHRGSLKRVLFTRIAHSRTGLYSDPEKRRSQDAREFVKGARTVPCFIREASDVVDSLNSIS
jgi:uncharacterized protein YjbI with pentapeptide repeats